MVAEQVGWLCCIWTVEYDMLPWTHFAEFVNLCFGPPIQFNPLGELKAL
jgi:hypothetical protein